MDDIASLLEFKLKASTPREWITKVSENFENFLKDHAAAEKKAMSTSLSLIARYPDKSDLVRTMFAIAKEELEHFEQVTELLRERGTCLKKDEEDHYIRELIKNFRNGSKENFLDRLLVAAIIENRGCERFALVANSLPDSSPLKPFYRHLSVEEAKHYGQYIKLARAYFSAKEIEDRLMELLEIEATIIRTLPITGLLH